MEGEAIHLGETLEEEVEVEVEEAVAEEAEEAEVEDHPLTPFSSLA